MSCCSDATAFAFPFRVPPLRCACDRVAASNGGVLYEVCTSREQNKWCACIKFANSAVRSFEGINTTERVPRPKLNSHHGPHLLVLQQPQDLLQLHDVPAVALDEAVQLLRARRHRALSADTAGKVSCWGGGLRHSTLPQQAPPCCCVPVAPSSTAFMGECAPRPQAGQVSVQHLGGMQRSVKRLQTFARPSPQPMASRSASNSSISSSTRSTALQGIVAPRLGPVYPAC